MPIRLLKKEEIVQRQNADRSKEIAEGLKISRRVDGLRELQAKEEQTLDKFRVETLSAIQKELSELNGEKETLLSEVKVLREEKAKGLKDVEKQLLSVVSFRNTQDQRELLLDNRVKEIEKREYEIKTNLRNSSDELERVRTHKEEAENLHRASAEDRQEANRILLEAMNTEEKVLADKAKVEQYLSLREQGVAEKEQNLNIKERELKEKEELLYTQKLQLEDREATLERELQRQKNGTNIIRTTKER